MNRKTWYTIAVIFVIALAGAGLSLMYVFKKAPDSVGTQKADFTLKMATLVDDFSNDETSADKKYLGKIIQVVGPVSQITADSAGISLYLKDKDQMSGIICNFSDNELDTTKIHRLDVVTVKGRCSGYLMDVVLNKCVMVKKE